MDRIIIRGGNRLKGRLPISGAKNSALALLPCALLTDEPVTLRNLPRLADVDSFGHLLNQLGASTMIEGARPEDFGRVMTMRAGRITSTEAPYDIVRKMRASILVLGPLLARAGEATVSLPGGCAIGNRPIDLHLKALEAFGAHIELAAGYVRASAPDGGLPGGKYVFPVVSVGATENALMAASTASGVCILENAAREPEITDLCRMLIAMGAEIEGVDALGWRFAGGRRSICRRGLCMLMRMPMTVLVGVRLRPLEPYDRADLGGNGLAILRRRFVGESSCGLERRSVELGPHARFDGRLLHAAIRPDNDHHRDDHVMRIRVPMWPSRRNLGLQLRRRDLMGQRCARQRQHGEKHGKTPKSHGAVVLRFEQFVLRQTIPVLRFVDFVARGHAVH